MRGRGILKVVGVPMIKFSLGSTVLPDTWSNSSAVLTGSNVNTWKPTAECSHVSFDVYQDVASKTSKS